MSSKYYDYDRIKELRAEAKVKKICTNCLSDPVAFLSTFCDKCLENIRISNARSHNRRMAEKIKRRQKFKSDQLRKLSQLAELRKMRSRQIA